ncbi:GTP diphosphokinase [Thiohalomonas denitrificans]|uniref:GTP pyrophosphokinase n=1 Tax=Thiohalomonas denitrificans TaxID=415747 RepID=A0A1G5R343_9GAMM|nr:GTP diphosphokinase [Thiohalomonas denitrificans]SCZ67739.1 GTP pyrophosphokinase [Thiohalomonas denitrificans]
MVYVENQVPETDTRADPEAWIARIGHRHSGNELEVIRRAVGLARRAHKEQIRASGEPYLTHVIAVADILAGLNLDHESLGAAILHDSVEDSDLTLEEIAETCGPGVAHLVDGVTKMRIIGDYQKELGDSSKESARAESLRKLLLAMAEDVRVVLIKLADRLHNMRTLKHLPEEKQRRIARETMDIYAPLANRLGIWQVKWELEDLAFRYLDPITYRQIARFLRERRVDRQRYIQNVIGVLEGQMTEAGIKADIKGRPKHLYSIWKKMQRKGLGFHQLYDVRAVRILVDSVAECYHVLGIVHSLWPHIPREFDDYIATPKENMYQSIHTAVVGPEGKTLEVQIRTWDMERHAELGVAAHWRYKEGRKQDQNFEQKIAWLRQLLEWKEEEGSAGDFIDRFKSEVFQDRVYVLTPDGEVIDMPQGATPLDFAYHIHSEVGNRCRGAKVDGRIVPLTYELHSGEQVEILTTRHGGPSRDWLNPHLGYLKTSRARSRIRAWFKQQDHEKNIADGKTALDRELHRLAVSDLDRLKLARHFGLQQVDELLIAVGRGDINTAQIGHAVHHLTRREDETDTLAPVQRRKGAKGGDIHIRGVGNLLTNMARCCTPAAGDPIVGFITLGRGVTIHRRECSNILNLPEEKRRRIIEVDWSASEKNTYQVDLEIEAVDRQGLLRDISTVLANEKINVLTTDTRSDKHRNTAKMLVTVEITDTNQLSRILSRIGQLPNILEARRRTR